MLSIQRRLLAVLLAATCASFVSGFGFSISKKPGGSAEVIEQFQHVGTDTFILQPAITYEHQWSAVNMWINGKSKIEVTITAANDLLAVVGNGGGAEGAHVHLIDETNKNDPFEFEMFGLEDDIKRTATYEGVYKVTWRTIAEDALWPAHIGKGSFPKLPCATEAPLTNLPGSPSSAHYTVSIKDNDKGLAVVALSTDQPYPPDIAEGRSQDYTVVLESIPLDNTSVIVSFSSNNDTLTITPDFVEFLPSNWNITQKVAVAAVDDAIAYPSPHSASFSVAQASLDKNFDGIDLPSITVTIEDNDFLANLGYSAITWSAETLSGQGSNVKLTVLMTISVVKSSIPASFNVGDEIKIDSVVAVGGEVNMVDPAMLIVAKDTRYTTLTLEVEHTFINSASEKNAPRLLSISHCCRQRELLNNKDSSKKTIVLADLDYVRASPIVGVIPVVHLPTAAARRRRALSFYGDNPAASSSSRVRRSSGPTTFQVPAYSNGNPLKYALGTTAEYGASLLGSPYGLIIDATTGIVSWDTSAVAEGLWNLIVVVTDLVTYGEITVELLLNVYVASADETPDLSCVKCKSTQYIEVGTEFESAFGASCGGSSCTAAVEVVGGLPTGSVVAGNSFKWTPTAGQRGDHIQCFQAVESIASHVSAPQCITMVVMDAVGNIPSLTVPAAAQFAAGGEGPAVLASTASLTLADGGSQVSEITVELAKVKDVGFEELTVDPSAVSLALGISQPRPETLIVSGTAEIGVFQSFLRNVRYTNSLKKPTVGDRTVLLKARTSDGLVSIVKTVTLTVSILNSAPTFQLDKNDTGLNYSTVFYRSGDPILISGEALLTDVDSDIKSATVTLSDVPDGADELLTSIYVPPPKLAGGGLYVSGRVDKKFGTAPLEPEATSTITVAGTASADEVPAIVRDVNVVVDITHSYIGDVQIFLEHNGRVEELVSRPGGAACAADDMYNTIFDQSSDVGLARSDKDAGACVGYTRGIYRPSDGSNLDNFNLMKADGDWTLRVKDLQLESDDGMIKQWGIALRTSLTNVSEVASITPLMKLTSKQLTRTHSLYVGASGRVKDINVGLNLFSSHMANTKVEITSPKGTKVVLFDGAVKCAKSNFGVIVFDDEAADTFADLGCTLSSFDELSTTFQPVEPLSAFVGERIIGAWVMTVSAATVDDLNVEFLGWSIDMNSQPNIQRTYDPSTGVLELIGRDTADEYETILSSIAYKNSKLNPTEAARRITTVVTDVWDGQSAAATTAMAIHHLAELALLNINEDDYTYTGDTKMCGIVCNKDLSLQKFNDVGAIIQKAIPSDNSIVLDGQSWTRSTVSDDLGIAVITADDTNGEWQFSIDSGSNWTPMNTEPSAVTKTSALTLHGKPEAQNLIRFVPNLDFHETATFEFVIWEMGNTDVSGKQSVNTTARDDISLASTTVTITVDPVNDSPIISLEDSVDFVYLPVIDEDVGGGAGNGGSRVTELLESASGTKYIDVDAATPSGLDAEHGIAVIHVGNANGFWQWMCDTVNGRSVEGIWTNFVGGLEGNRIVALPTEHKATLLGPGCAVRFEPVLDYNTNTDLNGDAWTIREPYITFKGWDNTGATLGLQGSPGIDSRQDSYRDWHSPFSNTTLEAVVSVASMNDLPELTVHAADVTEYARDYTEDGNAVALVDDDAVAIADADHARMNKLVVTLVTATDTDADTGTVGDVLSFNTADTSLKVTSGLEDGKLVWQIEPIDASDKDSKKLEDFALVLKSGKYSSVLEEPRAGERKFKFEVFDEEDNKGISAAVFSIITVVPVNDIPVLTLGTSVQAKYEEGTVGHIVVGAEGSIADNDHKTMSSMTATLVARPDGEEEFLSVDGLSGVTVTYTPSTGVLSIDGEASVVDYITMLQTIKYTNTRFDFEKGNPDLSPRTITYVVYDGTDTSEETSTSLSFQGVNDKPYVSFTADSKVYVEEEGAVAVFTDTVLYDIDSDTLSYVDVEIVSPPDGDAEMLAFSPYVATVQVGGQNTVATYEPTASNFANGKLRFSGLASVDLFAKILASVTYVNGADEPTIGERTITVTANDGELDSDVVVQKLTIELVNDAPSINDTVKLLDLAIDEDDSGATNFTTRSMLQDANGAAIGIINDDDNGGNSAPFGLAIVAVDGSNGVWEFRTAGAATWAPLSVAGETTPLTTATNALLVTVDDDTLLRFVPNQDYHGSADLSFVAWDGSRQPQRAAGARSNAAYKSATDAFSEGAATYTVVVDAVNDTPIVDDLTPITLTSIIEDDQLQESSWNDVADIVQSIAASDVDGPDVRGVAIISSDTGVYGKWQFSKDAGVTFVDIADDVSASAALLLSGAVPATSYIRFVPNPDVSGDATLTVAAWDETSFAVGMQDISDINYVTDPFSENHVALELEITVVNDSPVLLKDTEPAALIEDEQAFQGSGLLSLAISTLFPTAANLAKQTVYKDVDDFSVLGVVVVGLDRTHGEWFWLCPSIDEFFHSFIGGETEGVVYKEDPTVNHGTVLASSCRIRFKPTENFNTEFDLDGEPWASDVTPYIEFKAWDGTGDTEGTPPGTSGVDTMVPGGDFDEFSTETAKFFVTVDSVNDLPITTVHNGDGNYLANYTEDQGETVAIVASTAANIADADNAKLRTVVVTLTNAVDNTDEVVEWDSSISAIKADEPSVAVSMAGSSLTLTLVPSTGATAYAHQFVAALQSITYQNTAVEASPVVRVFEFYAVDAAGGIGPTVTTELTVLPFNDKPVLDLNGAATVGLGFAVEYVEGVLAQSIVDETNLQLSDNDNPTMVSLTVTLEHAPDGVEEVLDASNVPSGLTKVVVDGVSVTITGEAPIATYQTIARSITYSNKLYDYTRGNPTMTPRKVTFVVSDGTKTSDEVFTQLTFAAVNDEPFVDLNGDAVGENVDVEFIEEEGEIRLFTDDLVLFDIDTATLAYVEISIQNVLDGDAEVLSYKPYVEQQVSGDQTIDKTIEPVTSSYTNGILRIAGLDSVENYRKILASVTYDNTQDEPSTPDRIISVVAFDGELSSAERTATVTIALRNDAPAISSAPAVAKPTNEDEVFSIAVDDLLALYPPGTFLDDDLPGQTVPLGIAVVRVDDSNGSWSAIGPDGVPTAIGSVNAGNALLLSAAVESLSFAPNLDFHGAADLQFVAWDMTGSNSGANYAPALSNSLYSATGEFSADSMVFNVNVLPINDAPVVIASTSVDLTAIDEDDYTSGGLFADGGSWNDVADIVAAVGATDVDGGHPAGIAVYEKDNTNGVWQFSVDSGSTFAPFPAFGSGMALALSGAVKNTSLIRFVPALNFHETASIKVMAWDESGPHIPGTAVNYSAADVVIGEFSSVNDGAELSVVVNPINDAPIVVAGSKLTSITEDDLATDIAGDSVGQLVYSDTVAHTFSDVDQATPSGEDYKVGIAVVGVDRRFGDWRWQCNPAHEFASFVGGILANGESFPKDPSPSQATLLSADCLIKFVPNENFNSEFDADGVIRDDSDKPTLSYIGWDRFETTYSYVDSFTDISFSRTMAASEWVGEFSIDTSQKQGGTSSFSSETVTMSITVDSVNDPPIVALGNGPRSIRRRRVDTELVAITNEATGSGLSHDAVFVEEGHPVSIVNRNACYYSPEDELTALVTGIQGRCDLLPTLSERYEEYNERNPDNAIGQHLNDVDNAWFDSLTISVEVGDPGYDLITFDMGANVAIVSESKPSQCFDHHGTFMDLDGNGCGWYKADTDRCSSERGRSRRETQRLLGSTFDPVTGRKLRSKRYTILAQNGVGEDGEILVAFAETVPASAVSVQVADITGIEVGDTITFADNIASETATVTAVTADVGGSGSGSDDESGSGSDDRRRATGGATGGAVPGTIDFDTPLTSSYSPSNATITIDAPDDNYSGVSGDLNEYDSGSGSGSGSDDESGSGSDDSYHDEDGARGTPVVELVFTGIDFKELDAHERTAVKKQIIDHIKTMSDVEVEKVELKPLETGLRRAVSGTVAEIYLKKETSSNDDAADLAEQFQAMIEDPEQNPALVIKLPNGKEFTFQGASASRVVDATGLWTGEHAKDVCCACGGGHVDTNGVDTYTAAGGEFVFVVKRELAEGMMKYTISHPIPGDHLTDTELQVRAKTHHRGYNNEMPVTAYNTILESAKFYSRHSEPSNVTRTIQVVANDGLASVAEFSSIRIQLVASTHPVIDIRKSDYEFTEGSGPEVVIDDGLILADEDDNELFMMSSLFIFDVTSSPYLGDVLSVDTSNTAITFDDDKFNTTGVVVLRGPAPASDFATVLKTLSFDTTEEEPTIGARVYGIQVIDANNLESNVPRLTINVKALNDQTPKFNLAGIQAPNYLGDSAYAGGDFTDETPDFSGAATIEFLEDTDSKKYLGNVRLVDDDSGDLAINVVTFTLLNMQNGDSEKLSAISLSATINVTWNVTTDGVGTLTLQGPAKVGQFNQIMSTVVYTNTAEEPGDFDRTVEIRADDGEHVGEADITIDVEVVNDVPVIAYVPAAGNNTFTEGAVAGTGLFDTITIADNDHAELLSAVLVIENAVDGSHEELVVDTDFAAASGITHVWDSTTATLTLSSTAPLAKYQSLIASAKYMHSDKNPGNPTAGSRTIKVTVRDDQDASNQLTVAVMVVPVNDAAIVKTNRFVGNFVEESNGAKVANASLTVQDVDTPLLAYGLVFIRNVQEEGGKEALELRAPGILTTVKSADQTTTCSILKAYLDSADNGTTVDDAMCAGALVVEPKVGGPTGISAADLQAAFQNVYYTNSLDEPNSTTRQIGFVAFDKDVYSTLVTSSVTITMTNDAPVFYVGNNTERFTTAFTEGGDPIEILDNANVANVIVDDDHDHILSLSVKLLGKCAEVECGGACDTNGWCLVNSSYEGIYSTSGTSDDVVPTSRATWQRSEYDTLYESEHPGGRPGQSSISKSMSTFDLKTTSGQKDVAAVEQLMRDLRYINLNHNIVDGSERKITFVVADLESLASTAVSTVITLSGLNTEPITHAVPADTNFAITEDQPEAADKVEINVLVLFVDDSAFDVNSTTIQISTPPAYGSVSISDGIATFTAAKDDHGDRVLGLTLCDAANECSKELMFTIVIASVNDPPYPVNANLRYTILEDTASEIDFKAFFYDVEDYHREPSYDGTSIDGYQENSISWPSNIQKFSTWTDWKLRQRVAGSSSKYQLQPRTNKNSESAKSNATVFFTVCDSEGLCTDMSVEIYVQNVNDGPSLQIVFNGKKYIEATEDEDLTIPLRVSDLEDDAAIPKLVVRTEITQAPRHGVAEVNYNAADDQWYLKYTPDADYFGEDSVGLTVTDSNGANVTDSDRDGVDDTPAIRIAPIMVQAVRDRPRVGVDALSVVEDTPRKFVVIGNIIIDPERDANGDIYLKSTDIKLLDGTEATLALIPRKSDAWNKKKVLSVVTEQGATVTFNPTTNNLNYEPAEHFFGNDSFIFEACSEKFTETTWTNPGVAIEAAIGPPLCEEMRIAVAVASFNDAPVLPDTFTKSVYEDTTLRINVSADITDVEDGGTDWIDIVFVNATKDVSASGAASNTRIGSVIYDRASGAIVYTPSLDKFGADTIVYTVCDSEALCTSGSINVDVLPVNDPPEFRNYFNPEERFDVDEDRNNLIQTQRDVYHDVDIDSSASQRLMDGESPALLIEVITQPAHGTILAYSKNGAISYQPSSNYVGNDEVEIRVCDICSAVRNEEIRGDPAQDSNDPACVRERETSETSEPGGSGDGVDGNGGAASANGCLTVTLLMQVNNVNDNLVSIDLAKVIDADSLGKRAIFCPIDFVIETDDVQRDTVLARGDQPNVFGLVNATDVDYNSLTVVGDPSRGTVSLSNAQGQCSTPGASSIVYVAGEGSTGLDSFKYKVCDKQKVTADGKTTIPATCTSSTAHVYIAKAAPKIKSVYASPGTSGAGTEEDPIIDTDSMYGRGDSFDITFDMDTNMPPTNTVNTYISGEQISKIVNFSQVIAAETTGFHGIWKSASELSIVIDDAGPTEIVIAAQSLTTSVISKPECGPFDVDNDVYVFQSETEFCLKNAAGNSLPSLHTYSGGLGSVRGWGGGIGGIAEIYVKCAEEYSQDYFGPGCEIEAIIRPPMSLDLMNQFCGTDGDNSKQCIDLSVFGTGAEGSVYFENVGSDDLVSPQARRQTVNPLSTSLKIAFSKLEQPAAVTPSKGAAFFDAVNAMWAGSDAFKKHADAIAKQNGFPPSLADTLVSYVTAADSPYKQVRAMITPATALYIEGQESTTPKVVSISYRGTTSDQGATSDQTYTAPLQQILIMFDKQTNKPSDLPASNRITKDGVDKLMTFDVDIGTYQGQWTSTTMLEINVVEALDIGQQLPAITFRQNQASNGDIAPNPCRGINICGIPPLGGEPKDFFWGICDKAESSCRVSGIDLGGSVKAATNTEDMTIGLSTGLDAGASAAASDASTGGNGKGGSNAMAGSSSYAFLGLLVLIPIIAGIIYYSSVKRTERAENKRAMKAFLQKKMTWNGDGADGKPVNLDTSEMWNRPPGMVAMRSNPDPFLNLSGGTGAAPTAAPKVTDPFAPRAAPSMKIPGIPAGAGLQAPQRGLGPIGGNPQVGLSSLPALKAGGPGGGLGGARGTGLPPPKLPPMGRKGPGAAIPRPSQVGGGGARRPGPGNNRVSPGGPGVNRSSTGNRTAFQNIAGRASKGDLFNIARRTSNSSFNGDKGEDPFSRAGSGGGNRSNSMPRRPNFKGMAQGTVNANRLGRPNAPRGMPGQRPGPSGPGGPMSPPGAGGHPSMGGPGAGRGRGMPMAPGRGGGGGRGGGRGMPMSPPGAGGRGRPSMGGRGMPMAPRGRGMPGRGRGGGLVPPRASMAPPSAGSTRKGGAGFKSPSPAPSPKPVMKGMPGGPGGPPRPGASQGPGASSDPFSRPGGQKPPGGPPGGPPRPGGPPGPPGANRPGGPKSPGGPPRPGGPGASSDPFSRPGGPNSGAYKPPQ